MPELLPTPRQWSFPPMVWMMRTATDRSTSKKHVWRSAAAYKSATTVAVAPTESLGVEGLSAPLAMYCSAGSHSLNSKWQEIAYDRNEPGSPSRPRQIPQYRVVGRGVADTADLARESHHSILPLPRGVSPAT